MQKYYSTHYNYANISLRNNILAWLEKSCSIFNVYMSMVSWYVLICLLQLGYIFLIYSNLLTRWHFQIINMKKNKKV